MSADARFDYAGDPDLEPRIDAALRRVVDPEMALDILALGLVYTVDARESGAVKVRITMTSAACPVAELIGDEIAHELKRALGEATRIDVELVWDPPWSPDRLSASARAAMAWD